MSEIKHPFEEIKVENKSTEDGINSAKQLAYDSFLHLHCRLFQREGLLM